MCVFGLFCLWKWHQHSKRSIWVSHYHHRLSLHQWQLIWLSNSNHLDPTFSLWLQFVFRFYSKLIFQTYIANFSLTPVNISTIHINFVIQRIWFFKLNRSKLNSIFLFDFKLQYQSLIKKLLFKKFKIIISRIIKIIHFNKLLIFWNDKII